MRDWDVEKAMACIKRNGGRFKNNKITVQSPGIKVLGAIDYLVNYKGFVLELTTKKK